MDGFTKLPIYTGFHKIKSALESASNLILKSPTGSGKSLGLPLLLLKENLIEGQILVVQPRRIAARLLASQACKLMGVKIGQDIGYQVRFEKASSQNTKLVYLTDGILFRKLLDDKLLSRVGLIIFDEFHERTLQMDTSLALLKEVQEMQRPSLRLIIASATLNTGFLSNYLTNCKCIELDTRMYPVEIDYRPLKKGEFLWKKVSQEVKRCASFYSGDILIFVSGIFEISKIIFELQTVTWSKDFDVTALHGDMKVEDQDRALEKRNKRKIIVSTNIAETSLTIEGVQIVIDSGVAKKFSFDSVRGINVLLPSPISKNAADQRAGRAGRIADGYCVRLWNKKDHMYRADNEKPQILSLELSGIYLNLCLLDKNPYKFSWLEPPTKNSLDRARETLVSIDALNLMGQITEKGAKVCRFPLPPPKGMALLKAKELDCFAGLALVFALMEERSHVIRKAFDFHAIDKFLRRYENNEEKDNLQSDLRILLGSWLYAKQNDFSLEICRKLGIHAQRCRDIQKSFFQLCEIAEEKNPEFKYPDIRTLAEVLLLVFPDHLARLKNRASMLYESLNGETFHLSKYSDVKSAKWVLPLLITEKTVKTKVLLQMEFVTEICESVIRKIFHDRIKQRNSVRFDLILRKVFRKEYDELGKIKFNVKETESNEKSDIKNAYVEALMSGDLNLKNWNNQVDSFLARISFITENYDVFPINAFDEDYRSNLFEEICSNTKTWKEIKNSEVLPALKKLYSKEELELLDTLVPDYITINKQRKPYKIYYDKTSARVRVKIQDLYDLKKHPKIVLEQYSLIIELLAPNNRCVQVTDKISEFWSGSYIDMKKELAGRYPKHEWI